MSTAAEIPPHNDRRRGWPAFPLALFIGVAAQGAMLVIFHPNLALPAPLPEPPAYTHYSDDEVMRQEATASDPQSLYRSTDIARPALPAQSLYRLAPYPLQPQYADVRSNLRGFSTNSAPAPTAVDTLKPQEFDPLDTIATTPKPVDALPARGAQLRITRWQTGAAGAAANNVENITWGPDLAPAASSAHWGAARFLLVFTTSGLSGPPQIQSSSGVPDVDDDLRQKLTSYFRRNPERIPGTYTVEIGP